MMQQRQGMCQQARCQGRRADQVRPPAFTVGTTSFAPQPSLGILHPPSPHPLASQGAAGRAVLPSSSRRPLACMPAGHAGRTLATRCLRCKAATARLFREVQRSKPCTSGFARGACGSKPCARPARRSLHEPRSAGRRGACGPVVLRSADHIRRSPDSTCPRHRSQRRRRRDGIVTPAANPPPRHSSPRPAAPVARSAPSRGGRCPARARGGCAAIRGRRSRASRRCVRAGRGG